MPPSHAPFPVGDAELAPPVAPLVWQDEELEPEFDFEALAALTEGYTGSDLRNLCIAAAYRPIRDFLEVRPRGRRAAKSRETRPPAPPHTARCQMIARLCTLLIRWTTLWLQTQGLCKHRVATGYA